MRKTQKLKRFLSLALALSLCLGLLATSGLTLTAKAAGATVEFNAIDFTDNGTATPRGEVSATNDGVTVTAKDGLGTTEFRVYQDSGLTISATSNISKVEITCDAVGTAKYGPGHFSGEGYASTSNSDVGTWTGSATTVNLTNSAQVRINKIVVTLGEGGHTHTWDEGKETTPATCTTAGVKTFTCTDTTCGETKTEDIPATGHTDANNDKVCDIETCKADLALPIFKKVTAKPTNGDWSGVYLIVSENLSSKVAFDGDKINDKSNNTVDVTISEDDQIELDLKYSFIIAPSTTDGAYTIKGHNGPYIGRSLNSNGLDIKDQGQDVSISYVTDHVEITSAGGPKLQAYISGSNTTFKFYKTNQKTIQLYKLDLSDKPVINVVSATLDGKIGLNYYLSMPQSVAETAKVELAVNGNSTVGASVNNLPKKDGLYQFTYRMDAKNMYDQVTIKVTNGTDPIDLYYTTGEKVKEYTCSVAEYLQTLSSGTDEVLTNLANATRDYGAYAKIHFKHNPDIAVNPADVKDVTIDAKYQMKMPTTMPEGLTYAGMTLTLEEGTKIRLYFQAAAASKYTLDGTEYTMKEKDGLYYVEIENIAAKDLGAEHTLVIGGSTWKFSALSYAYTAVHEGGTNEESVLNVVKALNQYYLAADAYAKANPSFAG